MLRKSGRAARVLVTAGLVSALLQGGPVLAKEPRPPMPVGYDDPGLPPDSLLPRIIAGLRTTLKDPYSIRDFTLCSPEKVGPYFGLTWVPAHWITKITLNARNSLGGYTGSTMFTVEFDKGAVTNIAEFRGLELVGADVNAKLLAAAQSCPRVADAEIQRLLAN